MESLIILFDALILRCQENRMSYQFFFSVINFYKVRLLNDKDGYAYI